MKKTLQYILISGGVVLLSGFLVNAMSVKKEDHNIFEQAEAELTEILLLLKMLLTTKMIFLIIIEFTLLTYLKS